jgi:hypothetical protein
VLLCEVLTSVEENHAQHSQPFVHHVFCRNHHHPRAPFDSAAFAQHYQQTDLVVNSTSVSSTATIDPNLVNAWGLARGSGSHGGFLIMEPAFDSLRLRRRDCSTRGDDPPPTAPTGTVLNFTMAFRVKPEKPAVFLLRQRTGPVPAGIQVSTRPVRSSKWITSTRGHLQRINDCKKGCDHSVVHDQFRDRTCGDLRHQLPASHNRRRGPGFKPSG